MTNRQLAAQQTRRRLVEAAKKLIAERGLSGTSVAEIAEECGVASGTFYTYFKRKEDVVFELSREVYGEIYERALNHGGTFIERLVLFMAEFSDYIEKSSLKLCQEWVRNTVDPELSAGGEGVAKLRQDIGAVTGLIESGVSCGELSESTPVKELAHAIVDILYGQMLCWDMSGGAYSFAERTKQFCELFLRPMFSEYIVNKTCK